MQQIFAALAPEAKVRASWGHSDCGMALVKVTEVKVIDLNAPWLCNS